MPRRKLEEVVDGIYMEPVPITVGEEVRLKYKGILAKEGADSIYLRTGYGFEEWRDVQDIKMKKGRDGSWSASLVVTDATRFNFCFHDGAGNWDNNFGRNWSYEVHNGEISD
ncbi:MAG TPA: carbohydrate-binding protein [Capillibacterium sp.]